MSLKLKEGVELERLREFGFKPGIELAALAEYAELFDGREYELPWWHKFACEDGKPIIDEGIPQVHAWIDTRDGKNSLWFDAAPCCTYHISMDELDLVTDTIFALAIAGLIEKEGEK